MELIIVTGLSGAGKSHAVNCLEDIGYYCVDNMPPKLMNEFIRLAQDRGEFSKVAFVTDIRGGQFFDELEESLADLDADGINYKIMFLEASTPEIVRRYKETRRAHPLAPDGNIQAGIEKERKKLLAVLFVLCTVCTMIPRVSQTGSDFLGLGGGYSFLWLSILYVMGACLKKIRLRSHPPALYLSVFFCSVVFSWLFKILVENYTRGLYGKALYGRVFTSYTAPTMVICAVSLLLLFQNMKVGNEGFRSLIRFLSPMAFSVYLVQVQPYVWEYLLKDSCRHFYSLGPALCILMVLLSAFLLYCTCTAVDLIRVLVFRLLHVRGVCDAVFGFLGQRLDRLFPSDEGE